MELKINRDYQECYQKCYFKFNAANFDWERTILYIKTKVIH